MSKRNQKYSIKSFERIKSFSVKDWATEYKKEYPNTQINSAEFMDRVNGVLKPFMDKGFVIAVTNYPYMMNDDFTAACIQVRSNMETCYNAFIASMRITVYFNTDGSIKDIRMDGDEIINCVIKGNYVYITNGRTSVYQTHGFTTHNTLLQVNETSMTKLAIYFSKRYKNRITENMIASKTQNNRNRVRQIENDEIRSICDQFENYSSKNIYVHFYDSGFDTRQFHYTFVVNNRNDYVDLPNDSWTVRDCKPENPPELATIKHFKNNDCLRFVLTKSDKFILRYYNPLAGNSILKNFLNIEETEYRFDTLNEVSEKIKFIIDSEIKFSEYLNNYH